MKSKLTPEQSQRLIELGVDPSKASMCMLYFPESDNSEPLESWQMWEECGKLLCNPDESRVQDVECVIVPKSADYDLDDKEEHPIFDLSDILALLPKELEVYYDGDVIPYHLVITTNCNGWEASYYDNETLKTASELIDALYELLVWCLTNKYLNL